MSSQPLSVAGRERPPFVLIRGLARETRHWGSFPELLQRHGVAGSVLCVDLPGNGEKRARTTPLSVAAIASVVRDEALSKLGRGSRPIVVGLSLGGMVALEWARQDPQNLAGLVLINTSVGGLSPPWHRIRFAALLRLLALLASSNVRRREDAILSLSMSVAANVPGGTLARWIELAQGGATTRMNAIRQMAAGALYRRTNLPGSMPRALVLAGAGDRLVNPACSLRLAGRIAAPVRTHPSAGHDLALEAPEWTAEQIRGWLTETDL